MLKSYRVVGRVAHEILVPAQGPFVLGFWVFGFGAYGVWSLGLTMFYSNVSPIPIPDSLGGKEGNIFKLKKEKRSQLSRSILGSHGLIKRELREYFLRT